MGWSRGKIRLIVLPVLVLGVAAALHVWQGRREAEATALLNATVTAWCEAAERGEDVGRRLPVAEPFLRRPIAGALVSACRGADDVPGAWSVQTGLGAGPGPAHPTATHHALVLVDGAPRLGLHVRFDADRTTIVGYWKP